MSYYHALQENVTVCVTAADPLLLLNDLNKMRIVLKNIVLVDALTIQITFRRGDYPNVKSYLRKQNYDHNIIHESGLRLRFVTFMQRPIIICGVLCVLGLTILLQSFVLFFRVSGNSEIPTALILEKLSENGVHFGSARKKVRSEQIKNILIEEIPQLQWVGVNTDGCVISIHVSEQTSQTVPHELNEPVSSIVAGRDGVILACTIIRGTPLCRTGQVVVEGERLVSGYTDCGMFVRATSAKAEVLALTNRELSVISPAVTERRGDKIGFNRRYSVRIGKIIINLLKDSGIQGATCGKIRNEKQLVLPGGFVLPVSLIIEYTELYNLDAAEVCDVDWLRTYSDMYLVRQMVAGQIVDKNEYIVSGFGFVKLTSKFICTEMIGQTKKEEITVNYEYD